MFKKRNNSPQATVEPEYNVLLLPIISAVMLSYNRPVSLDEIAEGVIALLDSQRDKHNSPVSSSMEATSDSSYARIVPTQRRKR